MRFKIRSVRPRIGPRQPVGTEFQKAGSSSPSFQITVPRIAAAVARRTLLTIASAFSNHTVWSVPATVYRNHADAEDASHDTFA